MTKRALVAGIDDYRNWHSAGFGNLQFCRADATEFAQLLVDGFGFSADDVNVLEDAEATRDAILDGTRALLSSCDAGDVACVYFAGHGDRTPSTGVGTSSSTYYETIVPYDGASMISDWEINRIARSLELSRVNFTIVLDSCHSGGVYDVPDDVRTRGRRWPQSWVDAFQSACETLLPFICLPDPDELEKNIGSIQITPDGVTMTTDPTKDYTRVARASLLSACNFNEYAEEHPGIGHGRFTHAMLSLVNRGDFRTSYRDFHTAVRNHVRSATGNRQSPQLRGRQIRLEEDFLAGWNYSI